MKIALILMITTSMLVNSCQNKQNGQTMRKETNNEKPATLQEALEEKKSAWVETASQEKKRIYNEGIEDIIHKGILEQSKQIGDKAPDFTLTNATAKTINLYDYLEQGPVILTWYRGGWCPYCNLTLKHMQEALPGFKSTGANLLALTPELPDKSLSTKEKHDLKFEVLSDVGNEVADAYGVVFTLTPEVAESYQNAFDLHAYNGDVSNQLPLAATYIIDQDGIIKYAFLDPDYRNRAEPEEILEVLEKL
jgi:peroxiredoxin